MHFVQPGHFLLTYQLMDLLIQSGPSRVVNVSALLHFFATLGLDDFMMAHNYGPIKAYNRSKLAQVVYTRELAKRLKGECGKAGWAERVPWLGLETFDLRENSSWL